MDRRCSGEHCPMQLGYDVAGCDMTAECRFFSPASKPAYHIYRTGERCPCCGQPIKLTDPASLEMFSRICAICKLPPWPEDAADEV